MIDQNSVCERTPSFLMSRRTIVCTFIVGAIAARSQLFFYNSAAHTTRISDETFDDIFDAYIQWISVLHEQRYKSIVRDYTPLKVKKKKDYDC